MAIDTLKEIKDIVNRSLKMKNVKAVLSVSEFLKVIESFYDNYISENYGVCFQDSKELLTIYHKILARKEAGIKKDVVEDNLEHAINSKDIDLLAESFVLLSGCINEGLQNLFSQDIYLI